MIKTTKVLGMINVILSSFIGFLGISVLFQMEQLRGDWGAVMLAIIGGFFIMVSLVLTIPLIIFLIKYKLEPIKFYFYSHLALIFVSVFLFAISITL